MLNYTKRFGWSDVKVSLTVVNGSVQRVDVYDLNFSTFNPTFSLGLICGRKTHLCSGWTTAKDFDKQTLFAEAVMEAHHIFQENFTTKELNMLGYK